MAQLSFTPSTGFETSTGFVKNTPIVDVSIDSMGLIESFEKKLKERVLTIFNSENYSSVDDILIKKFHLSNIDKLDFPDYRNKTEFISKGVRGNLQKCDGNVLSYIEADKIIDEGIEVVIP